MRRFYHALAEEVRYQLREPGAARDEEYMRRIVLSAALAVLLPALAVAGTTGGSTGSKSKKPQGNPNQIGSCYDTGGCKNNKFGEMTKSACQAQHGKSWNDPTKIRGKSCQTFK